mgnify:CR=1 FL=1
MEELIARAKEYFRKRFDGVIRIEFDNAPEAIWIDGRVEPPSISETAPPNLSGDFCLWRTTTDTLSRVLSPETRRLESAYIAGRLTVSGDMAVMARLEVGPLAEVKHG